MQNVWNVIQLISISLGFVLLFLLYLLNNKFENPLFKYSLYLQTATQVYFTFDLVAKSFGLIQYAHETTIICYHVIQGAAIFFWMMWAHRIIQKSFKVKAHIVAGIAMIAVILGLIFNLVNKSDEKIFIFISVIITLIYANILLEQNIEKLVVKKVIPHMKLYIRLTSLIIIPAVIIPGAARNIPEAAFILSNIDFSILLFLAINIVILTSVTILFFSPNPTGTPDIPGEITNLYDLSPAEIELSNLIAKGYTVKAISSETKLSPQTIKNYTTQLYRKLNIRNRIELINLIKGCTIAPAN